MSFLTAYLWFGAATAAMFMFAMIKNRLLRDMVEHEIEHTFMEMDDDDMRETFRMLTLMIVVTLIAILWPRYLIMIARFL